MVKKKKQFELKPQHLKTGPSICHKCDKPLKVGDEIFSKRTNNRSFSTLSRYHLDCAKAVNLC